MRNLLSAFRRQPSLGLDVGRKTVKWVWFDVDKRRILDCGCVERDHWELLSGQLPPESGGANTALQGAVTAYGYLEVPQLADDELSVAVQAEAQQWIPFPLENTEFRYQKTPPRQPGTEIGAFYAAALREPVEELRSLLAGTGHPALRVEVPALALAREHHFNHPELATQYCGLLHIGYTGTHFALTRGGFPYYARDFAPGAGEFVEALELELNGDRKEAELCFYQADFEMPALGPPLSRLLTALRRTLRHCDAGAVPLFLSGGGATGNLARVLSERLGLAVTRDPWHKVEGGQGPPEIYKLAVGLAIP